MLSLVFILPLLAVGAVGSFLDFSLPELPNSVNEMLEKVQKEKEMDIERHSHHHYHPHHHFPPPPFLRKVSYRARREFYRIVFNRDVTRTEKKKELDDWAKKQGDDILKDLHDYEAKVEKFVHQLHKNTTDTIDKLADAYKKVLEILANPDLTPRQAWEKLKDLCLPSAVARSLRAVSFIVAHPDHRPASEVMPTPAIGFGGMAGGIGFGEDFENNRKDKPIGENTDF